MILVLTVFFCCCCCFYNSSPKKWQEVPLGSHTFHFTSFAQQTPARPSSPKRRPTFPLPTPTPMPPVPITASASTSTTSLSPSISPTNVPPQFDDVFVTANSIFSRSLTKLSVSRDLPRFCPNIRIYKSHEVVCLRVQKKIFPSFLNCTSDTYPHK